MVMLLAQIFLIYKIFWSNKKNELKWRCVHALGRLCAIILQQMLWIYCFYYYLLTFCDFKYVWHIVNMCGRACTLVTIIIFDKCLVFSFWYILSYRKCKIVSFSPQFTTFMWMTGKLDRKGTKLDMSAQNCDWSTVGLAFSTILLSCLKWSPT